MNVLFKINSRHELINNTETIQFQKYEKSDFSIWIQVLKRIAGNLLFSWFSRCASNLKTVNVKIDNIKIVYLQTFSFSF